MIRHHTVTDRATAKAKLLSLVLNAAARAQLSARDQAVLAHLVADSWLHTDTWIARTPLQTLATKLSCSKQTVRRSLQQLHSAELLHRRSGRGNKRSLYAIFVPEQPPGGGITRGTSEVSPVEAGGVTRGTSKVSPVVPIPVTVSLSQSRAPEPDREKTLSTLRAIAERQRQQEAHR